MAKSSSTTLPPISKPRTRGGEPTFADYRTALQALLHLDKEGSALMDQACEELGSISTELSKQIAQAKPTILEMPLSAAIAYVVKQRIADTVWRTHVLPRVLLLEESGVLFFLNKSGHLPILDDLVRVGHIAVLDEIRCHEQWTLKQREEFVQCYVELMSDLTIMTAGIIPAAQDSVRARVQHKHVKIDAFLALASELSERDALIAQLLYLGAPSLESILELTRAQVNLQTQSIYFGSDLVIYPTYLMRHLERHLASGKKSQDVVFTSLRGEPVDRTHLNQAFNRVCSRMSFNQKISPAALLR